MKNEPGSDAVPVTVPPLDEYLAAITARAPRDADPSVVHRLATLRRSIAFHEARLENDPGNGFSADLLIKLINAARRDEQALGLDESGGEDDDELRSIRRG